MPKKLATHGELMSYQRGCRCAECRRANAAYCRTARKKRGKDYVRNCNLKQAHGITLEEYNLKLKSQRGVCACCGDEETGRNQFGVLPLAVDYDHATGRLRGLLCMKCNRALGLLGDSISNLQQLIGYLENTTKHVYVCGPMRGIPEFNFPAFHAAAKNLREQGYFVFNPAEEDIKRHGIDISKGNKTGSEALAKKKHSFNIREALLSDLKWICAKADIVAVLPGWENSKGANSEIATARALGLEIIFLGEDYVAK